MEFNVTFKINKNIEDESININIESAKQDAQVDKLIDYINKYDNTIIGKVDNKLVKIQYSEIRYFFCKDKEIFCKTKEKEYKVKSR